MSINVNDKNLGHATAYAYYKAGGGTMTEAEFTEFMADFGTASQTAVEAAQATLASKNAAQTAATTATNKASEATTAATTATTAAESAQADADAAALDASQALSAASTATTKATEATTAAATAVSAKDDAVSANTAAQSAKTAAQTAQTGAETAAASVQSSAAQIQTNADDISELKEDLTQQTIFADTAVENINTVYDLTYTNNAMNDTTGEQSDVSAKRASTPDLYYYPPACNLCVAWDNTTTYFGVYCYDENKNYLGRRDPINTLNGRVMLYGGTRYLRFFQYNRNDADISPADAKQNVAFTLKYIGRIKDLIEYITSKFTTGKNLIDPNKTTEGYMSDSAGGITSSSSYLTTDYIPINAGQSVTISPKCRKFLAFDGTKKAIGSTYINDGTNSAYTFTATQNGFIRASYAVGTSEQIEHGSSATTYEAYKISNAEGIDFSESQKAYIEAVVDPIESAVEGIEESFQEVKTDVVVSTTVTKTDDNSGYYNQNGYYTDSTSYFYSDLIPVTAGDKVYAETAGGISTRLRYVASYNSDQTAVAGKGWDNNTSSYDWFTVPDGVAYVRVSLYVATATSQSVKVRTVNGETKYFAKTQFQSILAGKKWVACGDSFTEGDFSGLQAVDYQFQSGKYVGKKRVYPFVIGLRTGAEIVNEAISGSTMAYVDGARNEFSTPSGRYTQIPSDADYITLYFGINDSHHSVPIGTISDSDNTTFYGAWNVVMQYLIANHPNAKIGIIISNGCDTIDYPNAEIAIAKKYGVSYLDFNSDYKVPILFRVNGKPDVDPSVISANYAHYRVSATNGHPNVAMHEYESTIIQHWLESM